jgi:hypothetical protein
VNSDDVSIVSLLYSHLTLICLMVCFGLPSSAKCDTTHFRSFPLSFQVSLCVRFCCTVNRSFGDSAYSGRPIPSVIWSSPGSYRNPKLLDYSVHLYSKIKPWRFVYFDIWQSTYIRIWFVDLWNLANICLNIAFQLLEETCQYIWIHVKLDKLPFSISFPFLFLSIMLIFQSSSNFLKN